MLYGMLVQMGTEMGSHLRRSPNAEYDVDAEVENEEDEDDDDDEGDDGDVISDVSDG